MKLNLSFIGGIFLGVTLTGIIIIKVYPSIFTKSQPSREITKVTMFDKSEQLCGFGSNYQKNLDIFEVIEPDKALATTTYNNSIQFVVLVTNRKKRSYFDGQEIKIPENGCLQQIGIFNYISKDTSSKTVPIIIIE